MAACPVDLCRSTLWRTAFKTFLRQMQDQGIRPGVILDDPTLPYEPAECVSRTQSLAACESSRGAALSTGQSLMSADIGVLKADPSVPVLAPDSFLCDEAGCPLELHGHLLYADTNHLTLGATTADGAPTLQIAQVRWRWLIKPRSLLRRFLIQDRLLRLGRDWWTTWTPKS